MGLSICSIRQGLGQRGIDGDIRVAAGPPGDECGEEWWRTAAYRRLESIQRRVGGAAGRCSGWKARATIEVGGGAAGRCSGWKARATIEVGGGAAGRCSGWKARATIAGAEGLATATGDGQQYGRFVLATAGFCGRWRQLAFFTKQRLIPVLADQQIEARILLLDLTRTCSAKKL